MRMRTPPSGARWLGLLALALAAPPALAAQAVMPTQTAADSFLALIPPRSAAEIQRDLVSAEQDRVAADAAQRNAVSLRAGTEARIQAKKNEIETAKDRTSIAKREKREGAVASLEAERKALEREKDLLERRKSLRETEIDLAKKQGELAGLRRQALELENQLALKRAERARVAPGGAEAVRLDQIILDVERGALEAQKRRSERERDVVDREKQVIERRLQIFDARRKLFGGG